MITRRHFLQKAAALGALLGVAPHVAQAMHAHRRADGGAPAPMRLLVLGGTGFIGPHLVRHAVSRGHTVSIFTRGRQSAELPVGVERLIGDRNGELGALEGRSWDAVVDDSATNPEWVALSTALLKPSVGQYLFTSSTGVYYPYLQTGISESTPVRRAVTDPNDGSESFGVRKAQCEELVLAAFGDRGTIVRPTYIVGPGDTTDRFPYWPQRLRRGGDTLAPGRKTDAVQLVDVRDLAQFMIHLLETPSNGIYNVAGPRDPLTIEQFLLSARAALGSTSRFVWVEDYEVLRANRVFSAVPWIMLRGNDLGHTSASNARAFGAGLTVRPLAETVRDTLAWWDTVSAERRENARFSISAEAEAALLAQNPM